MCVGSVSLEDYFALGTYKQSTGVNDSMNAFELYQNDNAFYVAGNYKSYGGSDIVKPNASFTTVGQTCVYPGEIIQFVDESTNSPTSWQWQIYNDDWNFDYTEQSFYLNNFTSEQIGWFDVQLCATNDAGTDCVLQNNSFQVGGPGECTYEPITNVTTQPTIQLVPTGVPNLVNSSVWKESFGKMGFCNSTMGGACQYYINTTDMFADVVNGTFSGVIGIFTSPLDWVSGAVESVDSDIQTLVTPLIEQSSIFLGIMTRAFVALPAVMVNIVTLGLLIDIVRIVLKGRGEG